MPFTNALVTVPGSRTARASMSYRRNRRSKLRGMPNLVIGIPKCLAGDTVKSGDYFRILLGDGDDAGKARIARCNGGGDDAAAATVLRGSVVLRFGHVPILGADAAEKETIELHLVDDGFELELPKWFAGRI